MTRSGSSDGRGEGRGNRDRAGQGEAGGAGTAPVGVGHAGGAGGAGGWTRTVGPAQDRPTAGRGRGGREEPTVPPAEFRSYYGRPILKRPVWEWKVPAYFFTGGLSAGSALLAAGADLTGRPALRRASRLGALGSLAASGVLLVADLGRPERFHHMLRVAKPTSPMSVGSWILAAYAPGVGLAALAELLPRDDAAAPPADSVALPGGRRLLPGRRHHVGPADRDLSVAGGVPRRRGVLARRQATAPARRGGVLRTLLSVLARPAGLSSAAVAPAVASYTAVLLSQTAVPAWHEAHPYLPFVYTGSAAASAGGLGMALAPVREAGPARALAAYGAVVELAATSAMTKRLGLVAEAYTTGTSGRLRTWSERLTLAGLAGSLVARRSRTAAVASGLALLAASLLQRFATFEAGAASTEDPRYVVVPQRRRLDARR